MQSSEAAKTAPSRRLVRASSDIRQPCRECARRKGKCDGAIPVCSVCQRYNRHCLYDKHSRTALTRKHLTEVEDRLERAEALLKQVFTESQLKQLLGSPSFNVGDVSKVLQPPSQDQAYAQDPPAQPDLTQFNQYSMQTSAASALQHHDLVETTSDVTINSSYSYVQSPTAKDKTPMPLENLPAAEDDFEWDEREPAWNAVSLGNGNSVIDGIEGDVQKVMDGMAALSADNSNSGYLGGVSGAALLRTIWMSNPDGPDRGNDANNARRRSLEHIFRKDSSDSSSPPSWLRTQPALTRVVAETLIDGYFGLYHTTFPILHEPTFREQYAQLSSRQAGSTSHVLAQVVIALGSFVLSNGLDDTDANIFSTIKSQISIGALETGSLALVQVFALSANYLQKRNKPNSGYSYGGVALRLAIGLGLHKEFEGWKAAPLKMEIRRRVWWCLCVLDVGSTITYGRPLNWPQVGVETALPLNINERDLSSSSTSLPPEVEEATIYSYIRTQSDYHVKTIPIYHRLISTPYPSAEELLRLDDNIITSWVNNLPRYYRDEDSILMNAAYVQGHSIIRWRFRNLRIIMYRPFLIRWAVNLSSSTSNYPSNLSPAETMAMSRCCDAAKESIASIAHYWRSCTQTRLAAWYVLYFLFQASLIPIHCLRRNPRHTNAPDWQTQIHTVLDVVNSMLELNPGGSKCRDVINRLCGDNLYLRADQEAPASVVPLYEPAPSNEAMSNSMTNWMTEVDTAIYEYDAFCDRIGNAAMGSNWSTVGAQDLDWGLL